MKQIIYLIVNVYDDFMGASVSTDGGAYSTFEKAKERLIEYIHEIWDYRKDSFENEEEFNKWFESCFQNDEKSVWLYDDGESVSDISIHQVPFDVA